MRKVWLMIPAALVLALGAVGVAVASSQFKQTSKIVLTATKPGKTTGFNVNIESSDPGAPNGQPQALKTLTVTFPKNTKFNFKSSAIKQCTATDTELRATGGSVCAKKSLIGSGSAVANGAPVFPTIPEKAVAYIGSKEIRFLLTPAGPVGQTLVLHGKVKGNVITTNVPAITSGGLKIVITALSLKIKAAGSGKTAFVTSGACSSKKFTVSAKFLYETGSSLTLASSSKCTK
jgi:hypothetical protein